jgi:hypothetical protein
LGNHESVGKRRNTAAALGNLAADTVLLTHVRRAAAKPPRRELAHRALMDITLRRQLRVLLVQGLRDGGELELTTPNSQ